ncbi:DUF4307 domain-containing protein [Mangrovihabitans endophyticus]|uniref:DUF4307 domain-containing protein n=1 Tax=Mangrovihabitans endophyticus TaxID=1751298 RepID=A0A8J3C276_9ACTN|nr:DUF4307 domain-containing protein [Mangrovihabitans endophyticus]GGL07222.1 hypothetical protein GCM10012284_46810 [Mangrovihabitans endophyticus]
MSETRTTTAAFPPGRYGHRREPRRRPVMPIVFAAVIAVVAVTLSIKLYDTYGRPDYKAQVIGWTDDTADAIVLDYTVRVPDSGSATCALRALTFDKTVVGQRQVTLHAADGSATITASTPIPTTQKAVAAEVVGCRPAG